MRARHQSKREGRVSRKKRGEVISRVANTAGVSKLLASLGLTGKRRVVLDNVLNTQTLKKTDKQKKKVLSKFMILCWDSLIVS